jgi:hypothetical protein|tara:strand:+ start:215 stop:343 length:129 start_codon:yes stop_codon:yes gene_type:complete
MVDEEENLDFLAALLAALGETVTHPTRSSQASARFPTARRRT